MGIKNNKRFHFCISYFFLKFENFLLLLQRLVLKFENLILKLLNLRLKFSIFLFKRYCLIFHGIHLVGSDDL